MEGLVVWKHMQAPAAKIWLVCSVSPSSGKPTPIVLPYSQVEQEDYIQSPEQHEALINVFTTPGGADRFAADLAKDSDQKFSVRRMAWDEFLKLMKSVGDAYQLVKHHAIRFDIYDVKPGGETQCREILYSRWIARH